VLQLPKLAPLRHADVRWECPELEADRKWLADRQNDANDPQATLTVTNENALEGGLLASIQERV